MRVVINLSEDFVRVASTKDILPSQMKAVELDGSQNICIANIDGKYYAINNVCTHEGGPLADGTLEGYEVECERETTYEVKVDGDNILIRKQKG